MISRSFRTALLLATAVAVVLSACAAFGVYHTVRKGETLYEISRLYDVPVSTLRDVNYMRDADILYAGQRVFVPGADRIIYERAGKKDKTPEKNNVAAISPKPKEIEKKESNFIWPVDGIMTSPFSTRAGRFHSGIDISAPTGTPIVAVDDGVVAYAGNDVKGYGNMIIIDHGNGFHTVYAHNSENLVDKDQAIKKGQTIAKVGMTGRASGPHLHFEVRLHKLPVDPQVYLP